MNIEESNKIVAEFMELEVTAETHYTWSDLDFYCKHESELKFHTSWDWLMPCYYKVRGILSENARTDLIMDKWKTFESKITNALCYGTITDFYNELVAFLQWYTTQSPTK